MIVKYIASQFSLPKGIGGVLSTFVMNHMNRKLYQSVLNRIPSNGSKILDIGFGNGYMMKRLLQNPDHEVAGLEISKDMIDRVWMNQQIAIQEGRCRLMKGRAEQIPVPDDSFNVLYSINTIYFWESLDAGLKEIYRVGMKDGLCILSFYDKVWLDNLPFTSYGFQTYEVQDIVAHGIAHGFLIDQETSESVKNRHTIVMRIKK